LYPVASKCSRIHFE